MIYIFLFLLLLFVAFSLRINLLKKYFFNFFTLLLILLSGFRYEVGCDWTSYLWHMSFSSEQVFNIIYERPFYEPGYNLLRIIIKKFGLGITTLNMVASIVFFVGLHKEARTSNRPLLFLALCFPVLIINMPFSTPRQTIAIGIFLVSLSSYRNAETIRYIILIIIAATFHASALLFLALAPFTLNIKRSTQITVAAISAAAVIPIFFESTTFNVVQTRYLSGGKDSLGAIFRVGALLLTSIYYVILQFRVPAFNNYESKFLNPINMLILLLAPLLYYSSTLADRYSYYFIPTQTYIWIRASCYDKNNVHYYAFISFILLYILMFLIWTSNSWHFNHCWNPYQFRIIGS